VVGKWHFNLRSFFSLPIVEPQIYRSVIDEVIASIKPEFDEYGVSEDILAELQHVSGVLSSPLIFC
jgi:hypothetical protein